MSDFGKMFISAVIALFIGHYLLTEKILESCADFGKFKSRGVVYECKPLALEKR